MQGAELTFQQLLLLAALATLIWRRGGWRGGGDRRLRAGVDAVRLLVHARDVADAAPRRGAGDGTAAALVRRRSRHRHRALSAVPARQPRVRPCRAGVAAVAAHARRPGDGVDAYDRDAAGVRRTIRPGRLADDARRRATSDSAARAGAGRRVERLAPRRLSPRRLRARPRPHGPRLGHPEHAPDDDGVPVRRARRRRRVRRSPTAVAPGAPPRWR